jgi:hypothetical protein
VCVKDFEDSSIFFVDDVMWKESYTVIYFTRQFKNMWKLFSWHHYALDIITGLFGLNSIYKQLAFSHSRTKPRCFYGCLTFQHQHFSKIKESRKLTFQQIFFVLNDASSIPGHVFAFALKCFWVFWPVFARNFGIYTIGRQGKERGLRWDGPPSILGPWLSGSGGDSPLPCRPMFYTVLWILRFFRWNSTKIN